jgi:hypothetical protein
MGKIEKYFKRHDRDVHVALVFKDFSTWLKTSCVGLNIAGHTTATALKKHGIDANVFPVKNNVDLVNLIDKYKEKTGLPLTHVVIYAPWITVYDLKALLEHFNYIRCLILSHSNVGFLQADHLGVELLRHYIDLTQVYPNLQVGGNSYKFVKWLNNAFDVEGILLPNLYPLAKGTKMKPAWDDISPIKIGIFGSPRPQKNFMSAVGAAILIQRKLGVDVEIHMNADVEDVNNPVTVAIAQMLEGLDHIKLVIHTWADWLDFIQIVGDMDLLLQPSYTESFNMVTADGISVGVPSVASSAIYWAPPCWKAEVDDCNDIAETGIRLLSSSKLRREGLSALKIYNDKSLSHWLEFLKLKRNHY